MNAYRANLAVHVLDATYSARRRLASDRPGIILRLGSFAMALAGHPVTAITVCSCGALAVAFIGARMVLG